MRQLRYLASARRDFAAIAQWYVELGETELTAEKLLVALDARCQRLGANPAELGRDRNDLGLPVRSFTFKRYLIFFGYEPGVLEVVRVVHGARGLTTLFDNTD